MASPEPALAQAAVDACVLEVGEAALLEWSDYDDNSSSAEAAADVWLHGIHIHSSLPSTFAAFLVWWAPAGGLSRTLWFSDVVLQGGYNALTATGAAVYAAGALSRNFVLVGTHA